jgi:hypothetical protein
MSTTTAIFLLIIAALAVLGFNMPTPAGIAMTQQPQQPTGTVPNVPVKPVSSSGVAASTTFGYKSDGSLTGAPITNNPATWPGADNYDAICTAIALAEGYNQGAGVAPYDLNNPGDLSPGDENGQSTCGNAQYHGGSNVIFFCTVEAGWTALRNKFVNIVSGDSDVYAVTDTWAVVASKYAGNSAAWLANVTNYLGVGTDTTPADYVNGTNA